MGIKKGSSKAYAQQRITAPFITHQLSLRMKHISTDHEGPQTFSRSELVPFIAFGMSLTAEFMLTRAFIVRVLTAYAALYGDIGVQSFLAVRPDWINRALSVAAEAVFDTDGPPAAQEETPRRLAPGRGAGAGAGRTLALPAPDPAT
jgi:hypothetical protein